MFDFKGLCDDVVWRRGALLLPLPPPDAVVIQLRLGHDAELWELCDTRISGMARIIEK